MEKQKSVGEKKQEADERKGQSVCPHLKKGRCFFGISGRKEVDGKICPFQHPRVCDALLNHGNKGKQGCKGADSGCSKLHPKFCHFSLNKGVCFEKDCSLGLHVKGSNTRAARTKAEENKSKEKSEDKRKSENSEYPSLPLPRQPASMGQTLGQGVQGKPKQMQEAPPMISEDTLSFLGRLLVQGLIQSLHSQSKEQGQEQQQEKEQRQKVQKSATLDLAKLMNFLTLQ